MPRRTAWGSSAPRSNMFSLMLLLLIITMATNSMHSTTAQTVTIPIKQYMAFPHITYDGYADTRVDFTNTMNFCDIQGGAMSADQTIAAHDLIAESVQSVKDASDKNLYYWVGGSAAYSMNFEPDLTKRCVRGRPTASLNCIYQWYLGAFGDPDVPYKGVAFFRGSRYNVSGYGPMNGFPSFFPDSYPEKGQPFITSIATISSVSPTARWWDGLGVGAMNGELALTSYVISCEVQVPTEVNTTTIPPTTKPPLWISKHWYIPFAIALAAASVAIFLILFCCGCFAACCGCGYGAAASADIFPMVLRERSDKRLYADIYEEEPNMQQSRSFQGDDAFFPVEEETGNVALFSNNEQAIYTDGNVY